ncbi:hypothetical protein D3C71_786390 [compost metagenome]
MRSASGWPLTVAPASDCATPMSMRRACAAATASEIARRATSARSTVSGFAPAATLAS